MPNDIRIHIGFPDHPKTKKLARKCGYDGVVCLLRIWCWAAENRPKGIMSNMDHDDIEIVAGWNGKEGQLIAALDGPWLDKDDQGVFSLHDWMDNQPWVFHSDKRSKIAKAAAKKRWEVKEDNAPSMQGACTEHAGSMQGAMLNDAGSNAPSPLPNPLPSPLPSHKEPLAPPVPDPEKKKAPRKVFKPPTVEEVAAYCMERKNTVGPEAFVNFYESKGWLVGKDKMKSWNAAVRTWEKNSKPENRSSYLDQCKAEQAKKRLTPQELIR